MIEFYTKLDGFYQFLIWVLMILGLIGSIGFSEAYLYDRCNIKQFVFVSVVLGPLSFIFATCFLIYMWLGKTK